MKRRDYIFLFMLGLGVAAGVAAFQHVPGYMDADYYYAGGLRLAGGHGFSEAILWNYLDDPTGLPHPSHAYWMPLASLLAGIGMKLSGLAGFGTARIGFILLAACIPPLTAALSFSLTCRREAAVLAGLLAAIPAFYLPYLPTTDTFGIYMALGASWLLVAGLRLKVNGPSIFDDRLVNLQPFLLGGIAGLMHLARADGVIWLLLSIAVATVQLPAISPNNVKRSSNSRFTHHFSRLSFCLLGYLLTMGPWMARNLASFGTPLAPGGGHALWITDYNELFTYPASLLTPARWWSSGLGEILGARLWAAGQNLQSALAVQGEIFLAPLILLGLWSLRRDLRVQMGVLAWGLTFVIMTLVFPFAGARGGFFHSGAALQPLLLAVVPCGLEAFVAWGGRRRNWHVNQARIFFQIGVVGLAVLLAMMVVPGRVIGTDWRRPTWDRGAERYARVEQALRDLGAGQEEIVMVNNPPGYYAASGRPAISIPYGDEHILLAVSRRYQAGYLLLEIDQIQGSDNLYDQPGDRPGLDYLGIFEQTHIYRFLEDQVMLERPATRVESSPIRLDCYPGWEDPPNAIGLLPEIESRTWERSSHRDWTDTHERLACIGEPA